MGGEKGIPIAVAERRAKVDDFTKIVTHDTIENIVNLYKTIIAEHGGSQEESTSISDILKIDGNATEGSPQQNDAFPFTIAGFIPTPISQQIAVTNLSHLAYLPVKSIEALYHGYKSGYKGKIKYAESIIETLFKERPLTAEDFKKYFEDEEKKKSAVVSAEDLRNGGKGLGKILAEYGGKIENNERILGELYRRVFGQDFYKTVYNRNIRKRQPSGNAGRKPKYKTEHGTGWNSGYA